MILQLKITKIIFEIAIYSRSSIQNINNWRFWIRKEKCIDSDSLIDKSYLYARDFNETKYQLLIKKLENIGINHVNDSKPFIEY